MIDKFITVYKFSSGELHITRDDGPGHRLAPERIDVHADGCVMALDTMVEERREMLARRASDASRIRELEAEVKILREMIPRGAA